MIIYPLMPYPKNVRPPNGQKMNDKTPTLQQNKKNSVPTHKADPIQHILYSP